MQSGRRVARRALVRLTVVLMAGAAAAACSGPDTGEEAFTVADSAGVRMVSSRAPAWDDTAGWTVADTPSVSIGVGEGPEEYQLYRVFDALRLHDGRIVVGNSGAADLRFFGLEGEHLRTVGGQGSGPGEFADFTTIRLCRRSGGRILATDGRNNRLHVFTDRGDLVRTTRYGQPPEGTNIWLWGCFADGTLMMGGSMGPLAGAPGEVIDSELQYFRYGPDGTFRNRLFGFTSRPRLVNRVGQITHYPYIPLTPARAVATGARAAYLGLGEARRIRRYDTVGALESIIEWRGPERRTTGDLWDRYVETSLEGMSSEDDRRRYRRLYSRDLPIPDRLPAYGDEMQVDAGGNLWVERYRLPWESERWWDVFDPEGRWLGAVRTPDRVRVLEIGRDYLLGRHLDELRVERVRLYRLVK